MRFRSNKSIFRSSLYTKGKGITFLRSSMFPHNFNFYRRLVLTLSLLSLLINACGVQPISIVNSTTAVAKEIKIVDPIIDISKTQVKGAQTIVLAGGCFWGVEAVFEHLKGVSSAVSGFSGGSATDADYDAVSHGNTGHAEAVKITYNPNQISLGQLLKVYFFIAHDPTQIDRQEPDTGTQYRSAIFVANSDQQRVAKAYIYHQDFISRNPDYPYVVVNDLPKIDRLNRQFPDLVKH
jgi:peptide-methionine (S)-S-oxide reductase